MHASGCGNEGIHCMNWFAAGFTLRDQSPPLIGYRTINQCNSSFKARREITSKPLIQFSAASAGRQPLYTVPQFCEGHNAQEYLVLIDLLQPLDNTTVGLLLRPLRYNVCVE